MPQEHPRNESQDGRIRGSGEIKLVLTKVKKDRPPEGQPA